MEYRKKNGFLIPMTNDADDTTQKLVEELVQKLATKASENAGLVMIRVHRPERMRGPADTCDKCKAE